MTVAALLASFAAFVPVPANVNVVNTPCPEYAASTSCAEPDGTVHIAERIDGTDGSRLTVAHELGHVWDAEHLTDADRAHYAQVIGDTQGVALAEWFADAYAYCAIGPKRRPDFRRHKTYAGGHGEVITVRVLSITCWWLHHPPDHSGSPSPSGVTNS